MRIGFAVLSIALTACAGETGDSAEGPAPDGLEARDAGTDGASSSVVTQTFEAASASCNGWRVEGARAIRSVPPRSGSYACKVCSSLFARTLALKHTTGPVASGPYVLTAWVRGREDLPAPDTVRASVTASLPRGDLTVAVPMPVRFAYDRVELSVPLPEDASSVQLRFEADAGDGNCLLIDDVALERVVSGDPTSG